MQKIHKYCSALIVVKIILISVLFHIEPAQAYNKYFYSGLGTSKITIDSSSTAIDGRSSSGLTMFGGYQISETWSMEVLLSGGHDLNVGPTQDIYYPADTAEFSVISVGYRKSFWSVDDKGWAPWLTFGIGSASISWETFFYSMGGLTYYYGFGTDIKIAKPVLLRLHSIRHHFSASDAYMSHPSYYTKVPELGVALVFRWGLPRKSVSYDDENSEMKIVKPRYGTGDLEWQEVKPTDQFTKKRDGKREGVILSECLEKATSAPEVEECHDLHTRVVINRRYRRKSVGTPVNEKVLLEAIVAYEQCVGKDATAYVLDSCVDIFAEKAKKGSFAHYLIGPGRNQSTEIKMVFCDKESLIMADFMDCVDNKVEKMNEVVQRFKDIISCEDMSLDEDVDLDVIYCSD